LQRPCPERSQAPAAGFSGPALCGESASPLFADLQIPRYSLIITGLLGGAARFRCSSACSESIFSSIVSGSFIKGVAWKSLQNRACQRETGRSTSGPWRCEHDIYGGVELVRKAKHSRWDRLRKWGPFAWVRGRMRAHRSLRNSYRLPKLKDLTFGGWDIFKDNAYQSAANAGVLNPQDLEKVKPFLSTIKPMKAAFDHDFVKMIDGPNIKKGKSKYELR